MPSMTIAEEIRSPRLVTTREILMRCVVVLALAYLILPLAIVLPVSLTDQRSLSLPGEGLSLQHYVRLLHDQAWLHSAWQSLAIGVCATVLSCFFGVWGAIGCWLGVSKGWKFVRLLLLLPLVMPPIIFAVAAFRFYAQINLLDTVTGVILAHTVGAIPFVVIAVEANLQQLDRNLVLASRSLGAGLAWTAVHIITPNIKPGIISGAIFAFLHSWDEVIVTLFITSRSVRTLSRTMWEAVAENLDPIVACVAVLLLIVTIFLLALEHRAKQSTVAH
jgi:putative spermidine/putrescine transport system permease protein